MPHYKSAFKRLRQQEKRRVYNKTNRSKMRTIIKKVRAAKSKEEAAVVLNDAFSVIDKMAKKGLIHKNNASKQKSKLTKFVSKLS
ncbi:MAG: 30S ribosomal protein S20 [Calditrichia bacterium]